MNNKMNVNELPFQQEYMQRVRALNAKNHSVPPKAHIVVYGCQQNVSDAEKIRGMLRFMGYQMTDNIEEADFIIFNTCAVREHAEQRVWGNVGATKNYKRRNENLIVAVCGCMAQEEKTVERFKKSYPYVDIVFGTHVLHRLPEFVYRRLSGSGRIFEISTDFAEIVEGLPTERDRDIKAWLPIMYGCNNFCTYCVVPFVRGRERSRKPEFVLEEAKKLIAEGKKEITLLGQNVNSYGKGESHGINFAKLLKMINDLEGDFLIRFMTSHPKDCTEELLETMSKCQKVERHLHLPFQSGSDRVLSQMNRRYTKEKYLSLAQRAKELMPDIELTSDIIVGFPGETYEDFLETVDVVKQVKFSSLFTFIFSPRENTVAAKMEDPVSREEKGKWFTELLKVQEEIAEEQNKKYLGKTYRVLCDDFGRKDGFLSGHTAGSAVIEFEGEENLLGQFVNVRVDKISKVLEGTVI